MASELSEKEIERRRDDAIRRALNTPPKPRKAVSSKRKNEAARKKSRVRKSAQSKPKKP